VTSVTTPLTSAGILVLLEWSRTTSRQPRCAVASIFGAFRMKILWGTSNVCWLYAGHFYVINDL
jgi:hypothetical protein